jgi:hypothetical protein
VHKVLVTYVIINCTFTPIYERSIFDSVYDNFDGVCLWIQECVERFLGLFEFEAMRYEFLRIH